MSNIDCENGEKRSILLVDDKRENLRLLIKILTEQSFAVKPARDAATAFRFLQEQLPDLILLDVVMPGMNGYDLCKQLKENPSTRDIPVIFISAGGEVDDKAKAFALGGVDYITKPFHPEEVLMRVRTHLALRAAQQRLEARIAERSEEVEKINTLLNREIAERKELQQRFSGMGRIVELKLIESKFVPYQTAGHHISIARIEEKFEVASSRRVTVLTAPAGYGKSTTLARLHAYVESRYVPAGWVSLSAEDNVPVRFLQYIVSALRRAQPMLRYGSGDQNDIGAAPTVEAALNALCSDLSGLGGEIALFLDDFSVIDNESVHAVLEWLIMHTPRNLKLFIASRTQLPLKLGKLRVADDVYEIQAGDLSLQIDEVGPFVAAVSGVALTPDQIKGLHERTEGWPAGLQLASLALKGVDDVTAFIDGFSGRDKDITAYVGEIVVSALPLDVAEFLTFTALFDRFSIDMCVEIFAGGDAIALLEHVRMQNLFLIPLDRAHRWYRYHPLFAEYLKSRFVMQHPDDAKAIYRKASAWFERHELLREAIRYALAGDDYVRAADLVAHSAYELMQIRGEHATLLNWVSMLPAAYVERRPSIKLAYAWSLMLTHRFAEAEAEIANLEKSFVAKDDANSSDADAQKDKFLRKAGMMRCVLLGLTDRTALALSAGMEWLSRWGQQDALDFAAVESILGYGEYRCHNYATAIRHFQSAKSGFERGKSYYGLTWPEGLFAIVAFEQGDILHADRILTHALEVSARELGHDSYGVCMLALLQAQVRYEQNRLDEAETIVNERFVYANGHGLLETVFAAYRTKARLLTLNGHPDKADLCLAEGISIANRTGMRRLSVLLESERIYVHLKTGQIERALDARAGLRHMTEGDSALADDMSLRILFVRLQLAAGEADKAGAEVGALLTTARALRRNPDVIRLLCLRAVLQAARGNQDESLRALDEALTIGASGGMCRVFEDESRIVCDLLHVIEKHRASVKGMGSVNDGSLEYLRCIIGTFEKSARKEKSGPSVVVSPQINMEEISERELQILRLLASGLGNKEIAAQLYLSEATIKWHLHHAYAKLGARNRLSAITRARELALL
jgi:ATP/maltotriose-dependent transcriptional regulator MalT/DNA-binding response OmpR family regulator